MRKVADGSGGGGGGLAALFSKKKDNNNNNNADAESVGSSFINNQAVQFGQ